MASKASMAEAHAARRTRLRDRCAAVGKAAVLVTRPANIHYLAGGAPSGAALLLGPAEDVLLCPRTPYGTPADVRAADLRSTDVRAADLRGTDLRGTDARAADVRSTDARAADARSTDGRVADDVRLHPLAEHGADCAVAAAALAAEAGADSLAVEEHHLTVARHRAIAGAAPRLRLADLGCAVEQQRLIKDDEEIACLRIAAEISDQALGELLESILVGRTERHLALELERRLIDHGADGPAFPTSVATGPNSGAVGHLPTDRRVEEGDFLSVCLGANYRGYRCALGRTFVIGTSPADWQIDLYELVFAAQRAGREALAPGVAYGDVDRAARQVLDAAGHGEGLAPVTGHGVGLEIVEEPQLSPGAMGKLDACVPVTVEPGVHLPGRGGVRIDDTLVVRPEADGGPELLTITTKELLAL